jgi:predicted choloylglycine hydrolase
MARKIDVTFHAFDEDRPGAKWREHFLGSREEWIRWLASSEANDRPSHAACRRALAIHMPELLAPHDHMVALFDGDPVIGQRVSYWGCPPLFGGCSVLALPGPPPTLLRSYDFTETFFDALIWRSNWNGKRVVAMCDGAGGCLDGVNEDGLAAALTFGGRLDHGMGFAIPIIVRYALETCATVEHAIETLSRLPSAGVQNVIVQDRSGASAVVYLRPDRPAVVSREPMVTNHQETAPSGTGEASNSSGRKSRLSDLQGVEPAVALQAFLKPPLHHNAFSDWFGTLYTAVYEPASGKARYHWKDSVWEQSIEIFQEGRRTLKFTEDSELGS